VAGKIGLSNLAGRNMCLAGSDLRVRDGEDTRGFDLAGPFGVESTSLLTRNTEGLNRLCETARVIFPLRERELHSSFSA